MHFATWKQDCFLSDQNTAFFYAKSHTDQKRKIKVLEICQSCTAIFSGNINAKWKIARKRAATHSPEATSSVNCRSWVGSKGVMKASCRTRESAVSASCQLHYYVLTMKHQAFWVQLLCLILTFMLLIGRIWKSYRDQDEEDKQRPGNFDQQLELETIKAKY